MNQPKDLDLSDLLPMYGPEYDSEPTERSNREIEPALMEVVTVDPFSLFSEVQTRRKYTIAYDGLPVVRSIASNSLEVVSTSELTRS